MPSPCIGDKGSYLWASAIHKITEEHALFSNLDITNISLKDNLWYSA